MKFPAKKSILSGVRIGMLLLPCCLLLVLGCGNKAANQKEKAATVQVKGSDTMVNVEQAWAEEYKKLFPGANIEISGGGSGVGIAALEKGTISIAAASRNMKKEEFDRTKENTGSEPVDFVVGYDALAVYTNVNNPLQDITMEQLALMYGEHKSVTKWSQIGITIPGMKNDNIVLISRQSSSGTYSFFREKVLHKKDFTLGTLDMNGSKEVVELVSNTKTAIGYSGMGYTTEHVKMLNLAVKQGDTAYAPTLENTLAKKYPLARSLHMYTLGQPTGETKKFIDWILSDAGQRILQDNGYVPIRPLPAL